MSVESVQVETPDYEEIIDKIVMVSVMVVLELMIAAYVLKVIQV